MLERGLVVATSGVRRLNGKITQENPADSKGPHEQEMTPQVPWQGGGVGAGALRTPPSAPNHRRPLPGRGIVCFLSLCTESSLSNSFKTIISSASGGGVGLSACLLIRLPLEINFPCCIKKKKLCQS